MSVKRPLSRHMKLHNPSAESSKKAALIFKLKDVKHVEKKKRAKGDQVKCSICRKLVTKIYSHIEHCHKEFAFVIDDEGGNKKTSL